MSQALAGRAPKSKEEDSESDSQPGKEEQEAEFYDPNLDDEDAAWVDKQRQGRQTDAILSCPGCLTTCCLECQQHDLYPNQYRAVFVTNCRVDTGEAIVVSEEPTSSRKRQRGGQQEPERKPPPSARDVFHPVFCQLCDTRLGVYDSDEIYHFTSVIASEA